MKVSNALTAAAALWVVLSCPGLLRGQAREEAFRWPDGKRVAASLSFDDARTSQIDTGLPLFEKHGVKVTFYVNPGAVERRLEGWKRAVASGHEIGNHTVSHPCTVNYAFSSANALEDYSLGRIAAEIEDANAGVERLLATRPATFAYPCGQQFVGRGLDVRSYVPVVAMRFLAGRGYLGEAANDPARCDLTQVLAYGSDGLTFEQMKRMVSDAAGRGGWVVFAGHEIAAAGEQATHPAALEQFLAYARDPANGVWLDTVRAVAEYVQARRKRER